jgi:hypothetical protein
MVVVMTLQVKREILEASLNFYMVKVSDFAWGFPLKTWFWGGVCG